MTTRGDLPARRPPGIYPRVDEAEAIAIEALSFMATDAQRMLRFLDACGLTPHTLRAAAAAPGFLAAVLEHFAADPALVETYAANAGRDPAEVARAREVLEGPEPWTSPPT